MPPKRKQTDDTVMAPATSTRSTRQSTKAAKKAAPRGSAKATLANDVVAESDIESTHSAKKPKTSPAKKGTGRGKKKAVQDETDTQVARKFLPSADYTTTTYSISTPPVPKTSSVSSKKSKHEPYTAHHALELFKKYADEDAPDVIGLEGFERLCKDTEMAMDGTRPLIFSWQIQAKEMGKISENEWVQGMATLKIGSIPSLSLAMEELDDLLFSGKKSKATGKEYDRTTYNTYASNPKAAFQKLYMYSFNLVKPEQSKNIDMETSLAVWSCLLMPKYDLMGEIAHFIKENQETYKATNKDLWSMMLEFCETVKPSLQDYEADGAWPTLLDDFVIWKSNQLQGVNGADKMDVSGN